MLQGYHVLCGYCELITLDMPFKSIAIRLFYILSVYCIHACLCRDIIVPWP